MVPRSDCPFGVARARARLLYDPAPLSPAPAGNSIQMNPARIVIATHRSLPIVLLLVALLSLAAGCVYRPNIQQGNLLKAEDVDQITVGMTRSQVRYVLGTPMVSDPFQPDRWDYVYTLRRGRESRVDRAHFVVYFEADKVSKVAKPGLAELTETEKVKAKNAQKAQPVPDGEPPAPPAVQQPQTDVPRPGGGA
jgi:outer membrane protein assembly factor BamE